MQLDELVGKTITKIEVNDESVYITTHDNFCYSDVHQQDCCERVGIEAIEGDPQKLVGKVIAEAYTEYDADLPDPGRNDSYTWTLRHIIAEDGTAVCFQWLGTSNGYYGEKPYFGLSHPSM